MADLELSRLLRQTAARYQAAVAEVLAEWGPDCGCQPPGESSGCRECPSYADFERRVKEKIVTLRDMRR